MHLLYAHSELLIQNTQKAATEIMNTQHWADFLYHWRSDIKNTGQAQGQLIAILSVELPVCTSDGVLMHHKETTWLPEETQNGYTATTAKMSGWKSEEGG